MIDTGKNVSLDERADFLMRVIGINDGADKMKKKNKAIVNAMIDANMTQTQLAKKADMHLTHVNSIVNGTKPRVDVAIKIARALETTVEKLWGEGGTADE